MDALVVCTFLLFEHYCREYLYICILMSFCKKIYKVIPSSGIAESRVSVF